jgi:hypothetical protein
LEEAQGPETHEERLATVNPTEIKGAVLCGGSGETPAANSDGSRVFRRSPSPHGGASGRNGSRSVVAARDIESQQDGAR